jgi:ComF family protein
MKTSLVKLFHVLKPSSLCIICHQHHFESAPICNACCLYLKPTEFAYQAFSQPIDFIFAPYFFNATMRKILHEFKYQEGLYLAKQLSSLMIQKLPQEARNTECLIPVPLHRKKLQARGFNQSAMLAQQLSKKLRLPLNTTICSKVVHTHAQAGITAHQRKTNLYKAFRVKNLGYQHVTIIDDLCTTGNTAKELALELKKNGVQRVDFWCCARVLRNQNRTDFIH